MKNEILNEIDNEKLLLESKRNFSPYTYPFISENFYLLKFSSVFYRNYFKVWEIFSFWNCITFLFSMEKIIFGSI